MRCVWLIGVAWVVGLAVPAWAAPELADDERAVLSDNATDRDRLLDQGPAMYVLLENAADWAATDFAGERGAATPPTPDYAYLSQHPGEVRGDVFVVEGRFIEQVRFPTSERDGRDHLTRTRWGDQLTAWGIKVGEGDDDVVMVYFVDPDHAIVPPENGQRVRVAARFYKVWSVPNREGRELEFLAFIGGGREVLGTGGIAPGGVSWNKFIIVAVVLVAGAYYGVRVFLTRKAKAGRARSQAMTEQRRRERGHGAGDAGDEEEIDPDLPEDPAEALAYLQARENENDQ